MLHRFKDWEEAKAFCDANPGVEIMAGGSRKTYFRRTRLGPDSRMQRLPPREIWVDLIQEAEKIFEGGHFCKDLLPDLGPGRTDLDEFMPSIFDLVDFTDERYGA